MSPTFAFKLATAIALSISYALGNPIESRSIDSGTFANLQLFEQFAAAAYCPSNNNVPNGGSKLTCPTSKNCPLVEADDVITVYEFQNSLLTDVTGYVALDHTRFLTVLAFRGSESIRNYIADADATTTPTEICSGCTADQGFYNSWQEAKSGVMGALKTAAAANPSYRVVVVGHSLGGAIAAIAAAELRNWGTTTDSYTYGQPRIGGATISNYITNQNKGGNFRVTHYDDPIPRLPALSFGFVHISPEYYIKTGNGIAVTAADFTELTGSINLKGNTANIGNGRDLAAHGWYFNNISACDTSDSLEIFKRGLLGDVEEGEFGI